MNTAHYLNVGRNVLVILLRLIVITIPWLLAGSLQFLADKADKLFVWLTGVLPETRASEIDRQRAAERRKQEEDEIWGERRKMRDRVRGDE